MRITSGYAAGADSGIRFKLDLVRMPDVSFIRWDSVDDPEEIENPAGAFLEYPPDLAVEVLSPGNTHREMEIKLEEYAKAGVKLVWYVDPERKEVDVYPKGNAKRKKTVGIGGKLDGGDMLPGFTLPGGERSSRSVRRRRSPGKRGRSERINPGDGRPRACSNVSALPNDAGQYAEDAHVLAARVYEDRLHRRRSSAPAGSGPSSCSTS